MKKYSVEEAKSLHIVTSGRTTKISAMTYSLEIGEAFDITRADWKGKKPPYNIINRVAKKTGRKFIKGRLPDGTGWVVKRIA